MMTRYKNFSLVLVALLALSTAACAKRTPSAKSAQRSIANYFDDYGDDYEESDFGDMKVDEVEIASIEELQNGVARVEAYVSLGDGAIVYKVGATLVKKAIRWRVISWENLGKAV